MTNKENTSPFPIRVMAMDSVVRKIPNDKLEELLVKNIKLSDYGTGIEEIYVVFLGYPPDDYHEEKCVYDKQKKSVEMVLGLDWEILVNGSEEEIFEEMKRSYLKGVERRYDLDILDFDLLKCFKSIQSRFIY